MCVQCRQNVKVIEVIEGKYREHIDVARYRCDLCEKDVPVLFRDNPDVMRTEIRPYDPDMAAFPIGF